MPQPEAKPQTAHRSPAKHGTKPAAKPTAKQNAKYRGNWVTALDIGSSKISCFIAQEQEQAEGVLQVIGIGHHVSQGVKAGNVVDVEAALRAINATLDHAEGMAGGKINKVVVNFSGGKFNSRHSTISLALHGREATDSDIEKAFAQGQQNTLDDASELLHMVPTDFVMDGQGGIRDPRGMSGEQLKIKLHAVMAHYAPIRALLTTLNRCHLRVEHVVVSPYASGLSCLVEDEMELGATVLDLGGGTTTLALFAEGQMIHADSIPLGGMHVTNDIARILTTPIHHAERLKTLFGSALSSASDEKEMIEVPQMGEEAPEHANHIPKSHLIRIIQPRLEEIFEHVQTHLAAAQHATPMGRRVVLTGGAAQMPGIREMAQRMLDKPVRIGRPTRLQGLTDHAAGPAFATTAGLLSFATNPEAAMPRFGQNLSDGQNWLDKIGNWLRNAV